MTARSATAASKRLDILSRDDGGKLPTNEQLRVTEQLLGEVAKRYMTVRALVDFLHDPSGESHPDPGGWTEGALRLAVSELGLEIERVTPWNLDHTPEELAELRDRTVAS